MRVEISSEQWDLVEQYFQNKEDGHKLSRKRDELARGIGSSFVKVGGQVYALGDAIDAGTFARVKWVKNCAGEKRIIKINNGPRQKLTNIVNELSIESDLRLIVSKADRKSSSKQMRIMPYLGVSLFSVLDKNQHAVNQQDRYLTPEQSRQWLLGVTEQVLKLHRGVSSATGQSYLHGDIKLDNFTQDSEGFFHLIDFGNAYPCMKGQAVRVALEIRSIMGNHIAPEIKVQNEQMSCYSFASDIFALADLMRLVVAYTDYTYGPLPEFARLENAMKRQKPEFRPSIEWVYVILLAIYHEKNQNLAEQLKAHDFAVKNPWVARLLLVILEFSQMHENVELLGLDPINISNSLNELMKNDGLLCFNLRCGTSAVLNAYLLLHADVLSENAYSLLVGKNYEMRRGLVELICSELEYDSELGQKIQALLQSLGILPVEDESIKDMRLISGLFPNEDDKQCLLGLAGPYQEAAASRRLHK